MAKTAGSQAGLELFDQLEIDYEHAYGHNELQIAAVNQAISLLTPGSRVLDVGCGTGRPVLEMLSQSGCHVVGIDISPRMVRRAQQAVPAGEYHVADLLDYRPEACSFDAVFVMFSHLQLSAWADVHSAMHKYANALRAGGHLVIGTMPCDSYVDDEMAYDETRTYVVDYEVPFMGGQVKAFLLSKEGMLRLLTSMGLEVVYHKIAHFQPKHATAVPEEQQYIVAKRVGDQPLPLPKPLPKAQHR